VGFVGRFTPAGGGRKASSMVEQDVALVAVEALEEVRGGLAESGR
jgi:hypothetical protein